MKFQCHFFQSDQEGGIRKEDMRIIPAVRYEAMGKDDWQTSQGTWLCELFHVNLRILK